MKTLFLFLTISFASLTVTKASSFFPYQNKLILSPKIDISTSSSARDGLVGTMTYQVPDALGAVIILYVDVYYVGPVDGPSYYTFDTRVSVDGVDTSAVFWDGYIHASSTHVGLIGVTIYYSSYIQSGSFVVPDSSYLLY